MIAARIVSLTQFSAMVSIFAWLKTATPGRQKRSGIFIPSIFRIPSIMRTAINQFEIFFSVIRLIPIYMMDVFKSFQFSSKNFLHYQAMLIYIAIFYSDPYITFGRFNSTTLPMQSFWSFFPGIIQPKTFTRTKLGRFCAIAINPKFLFTGFTEYFNHRFNIYHFMIESQG